MRVNDEPRRRRRRHSALSSDAAVAAPILMRSQLYLQLLSSKQSVSFPLHCAPPSTRCPAGGGVRRLIKAMPKLNLNRRDYCAITSIEYRNVFGIANMYYYYWLAQIKWPQSGNAFFAFGKRRRRTAKKIRRRPLIRPAEERWH